MKNFLRIVAALAIVVLLGVVIVKITKLQKHKDKGEQENLITEFSEEIGVLPTISIVVDDKEIDSLHGYTTAMDMTKIHDNLIVVDKDKRNFKVKIDTNDVSLKSIHEDILSFDGDTYILNEDISDYKEKKGKISFNIEFPEEGKIDKEWVLRLTLTTTEDEKVAYYSRVMCVEGSHLAEQVDFVNFFSETTLDYEKAASWTDGIIGYIEPDADCENSNLGVVTINSSFYQLTWGDMEVERMTTPTVTLLEMDKDVGAYKLTYTVKSKNEYEQEEFYNITEYFRLWSALNTIYLRSYNRTMEQIFEASSATITGARINLGIRKNMDFDYVQSDNNRFLAYVLGDSLWCLDTDNYAIVNVYSIERNAKDNIKDSQIEVMSVDDDGNVEFIVYGYLNSVAHMGKNGIVAYSYTEKTGIVRERLMAEYDKPYEILQDEVGTLYYIADGVLYIYIDSCINYVNLNTKEHGQIATDLKIGTFAVNESMNTLAFNTGGTYGDASSITVMNFETGQVKEIEANEGEKIRVCGYAGGDLIYGKANADEITVSKSGVVTFPIKDLYIVNDEFHVVQSYSQKKIRVTDVEIKDNMIVLKRTKNGKETTDDQLFETAKDEVKIGSISYIVTDLKETTPVFVFNYQLDTSEKIVLKAGKMYEEGMDEGEEETESTTTNSGDGEDEKKDNKRDTFGGETIIDFEIPKVEQNGFYLYINGELYDTYSTKKSAIKVAEENYGYVVDESGEKIYAFIEELQYSN